MSPARPIVLTMLALCVSLGAARQERPVSFTIVAGTQRSRVTVAEIVIAWGSHAGEHDCG